MNVGETMKMLITADDYNSVRVRVSDEFISMAKGVLGDYEYIKEKEEKYQELLSILKNMQK
jgi:hypothetical protein